MKNPVPSTWEGGREVGMAVTSRTCLCYNTTHQQFPWGEHTQPPFQTGPGNDGEPCGHTCKWSGGGAACAPSSARCPPGSDTPPSVHTGCTCRNRLSVKSVFSHLTTGRPLTRLVFCRTHKGCPSSRGSSRLQTSWAAVGGV